VNVRENLASGRTPKVRKSDDQELLSIPTDAGRYRDALTTVLLRIPEGYEKRIACVPGWYPIIAQLHKALCSVDVHYMVYSVRKCGNRLHYEAECQSDDLAVQTSFYRVVARAQERSLEICPWSGLQID
jgi:hypothetical protein